MFRRTDHLGKGGLAALARPVDQDNRRILQRLGQAPFCEAGVKNVLSHRLIVTFYTVQLQPYLSSDCKFTLRLIARLSFANRKEVRWFQGLDHTIWVDFPPDRQGGKPATVEAVSKKDARDALNKALPPSPKRMPVLGGRLGIVLSPPIHPGML